AFYHYRVVATNAAGTATGPDQTFQAGPGLWTPFSRCPVDDPIMLAADGVNTEALCVNAHSLSGSLTIGTFTVPTGGTDLQFGVVFDQGTGVFTIVPPPAGAIMSDPVTFVAANLTITGVVEAAGPPSNFDLVAGISQGQPIITVPVKFHLINDVLGPNCYIGSDQNPILLHPENTDISGLMGFFESFDPTGASDPNGPLATLVVSGLVQGDDTFAVPGSSGCGQNGSLNAVVDAVAGLPTPSGSNHLVLDEASSALALPSGPTVLTGQDFANDWHIGFGM
ncbi:MAG TPA: hypothetical protein VFD84_20705, partial [Candidatus Binatia bacterium]|nr:hypothetical protein [Candidatus Binatia bacterium]